MTHTIKKSTVAEMAAALNGHYTEELLFVLQQNIEAWKFFQEQMATCDQQVEAALRRGRSPEAKKKRQRPLHGNNAPKVECAGVD